MAELDFIDGYTLDPERDELSNLRWEACGARCDNNPSVEDQSHRSALEILSRVAKRIQDDAREAKPAASQQPIPDGSTAPSPSNNPDQDIKSIDPPNDTVCEDQN
jgi:hypothetical protein